MALAAWPLTAGESGAAARWTGSGPAAPEATSLAEGADGSLYATLAGYSGETGLFVRRPNEDRWRPLDFDNVFQVVTHPGRAETLYALNGRNTGFFGSLGTPARSLDGGVTWRKIAAGIPESTVETLTIAQAPPYPLFAVTDAGTSDDRGRLYRFDEATRRWRRLTSFPTLDVAVHPQDPDILYVAADRDGDRVLVSRDGGASWEAADIGLENVRVREITFAGNDGTSLYAWPRYYRTTPLFRSTDGRSWSLQSRLSHWITSVAVHPDRPEELVIGVFWISQQHFRHSVDGGLSWRGLTGAIGADQPPRDLLWSRREPDTLFTATLSGVFRGTSGLAEWRALDHGVDWSTISSLAVSPPLPGGGSRIYALQRHTSFLFVLEPGSRRWQRRELPIRRAWQIEVSPHDPDLVYAIDYWDLLISADAGETWTEVRLDRGAIDIELDPRDPSRVYLAGGKPGFSVSDDGGLTWRHSDPRLRRADARWLTVDPADPRRLYISNGWRLRKSLDGGETWRRFGPERDEGRCGWELLEVNPRRRRTMFLACNGWVDGLLRSRDRGKTWEDVTRRLPGRYSGAQSIVFDPFDRDVVYLLADEALYRSPDEGETWEPVPGGRELHGRAMEISAEGVLSVGTEQRGVRSLKTR